MPTKYLVLLLCIQPLYFGCLSTTSQAQIKSGPEVSNVWVSDLGNGMYKNPILHADYSDPDAVRVGNDYYMTASSFNCVPALPILHSKDLVSWQLVNHALPRLIPEGNFSIPQHGNGVWAPSIRYHQNEFYIYYGDPDYGIYMLKTTDPKGIWTKPQLVKSGKGLIDPCPLWDDDGKAYLVHAFAGSRSGLKSILVVHEMAEDGTALLDEGVLVFDGHKNNRTVEGPKFYKKDDYYYIFAPAGGVPTGWQIALRSRHVFGPYDSKVVLHQGNTNINGPHQGAWVNTQAGEDWFIHFQDKKVYGRVVHLQPMNWDNGWPLMGVDVNEDGIGEPVSEYKKPDVDKSYSICTPQSSDEFNEPILGLQWQWHANPGQGFGFPSSSGFFRLNAIPVSDDFMNLGQTPNLLLQKFTAEEFIATAKLEFYPSQKGDKLGMIMMGKDYAYVALVKDEEGLIIQQAECMNAFSDSSESIIESREVSGMTFFLRVKVSKNAFCEFSYSSDNHEFFPIGKAFKAAPGKWIGAKVGFFCMAEKFTNNAGYANIDWFRIEKY